MGKRVPTFDQVRDDLAEWARKHGQKYGIQPEDVDRMMKKSGPMAQLYVVNTLAEGVCRHQLRVGPFGWFRNCSKYAFNKVFSPGLRVR